LKGEGENNAELKEVMLSGKGLTKLMINHRNQINLEEEINRNMKGKFKLLGHIGLALFLVSVLVLTLAPVAQAATAVTDVWVEFDGTNDRNTVNDTDNEYIIHFKPATALIRGTDWVTVTFPDGTSAMGGTGTDYDFSISGTVAAGDLEFSTDYGTLAIDSATWKRSTSDAISGGYRVKIRLPSSYAAGTDVWLKISSTSITSAPTAGDSYKVYVSTTKDTTAVLSSAFSLGVDATVISGVGATVAPATAGATGQYVVAFTEATDLTGSSGTVTVRFPIGTTIPSSMSASDIEVQPNGGSYTACGVTPTVDTDRRLVTITVPETLSGDASHNIKFKASAGIINPTIADDSTYAVAVRTSGDREWVVDGTPHEITAGAANKLVIANGEIGKATSRYSDDATMINMYSSQIYVVPADQYGNGMTPASAVTVTPSSSSGTGAFYKPDAVAGTGSMTQVTSITANNYDPYSDTDQIVCYKDSTAGTHTLTFSATGYTSATWTVTIAPAISLYDSSDALVNTYAPLSTTPASETSTSYAGSAVKFGVDYINDAIDAAIAGDTIKLGDGIYELDAAISLNKKVTLTSVNGASYTTLRNTTTLNEAILVGISGTAANPVIIDGLTIERLRYGTEIRNAIWNKGYDYTTVRNCTFNYIMPDEDKDEKEGVVALVSSLSTANLESITVSNNTFNNCCTNVWPNMGDNEWDWGANINVMASHTGYTTKGVTISGNTLNNCDGYGIAVGGMSLTSTLTGSVTNNTLTDCFIGICSSGFSPAAGYSITGNTITGAYHWAIELEGSSNGDITIKNNTITGCALVDNASAIRIPGESDLAAATYCYYIQYNDIYDNASGTYSITVTTATDVLVTDINCNYNWFGDASGPSYTAASGATVTKSNPNGTGAKVSDGVYYYPWLHKPVTDVVADNVSYQTSNMKLVSGWNTLSTPVKLISTADSIDELIPSGMTIGYYYDGGWQQITTGYTLSPCDAVYVKMSALTYVQLKFDAAAFTTPSKALDVGWNMISLASLDSDGMRMDYAMASVANTAANLPGYSQVVSPSINANLKDMYGNTGTSWASASGETSTAGTMFAGLGYWCYMQNASTLAGFEITPIAPDLD
jgi:hypothetical protein